VFAAPALAASPGPRTRGVTREAQAVFAFGDSCVVSVDVTDAQMQVNRFCVDAASTVTTPLSDGDVTFTRDTARVAASATGWTVDLSWQALAKPRTVPSHSRPRMVVRDATAAVTGSITDGITTAGPAQLMFADVATVTNRAG
jgi:hypothetical protein